MDHFEKLEYLHQEDERLSQKYLRLLDYESEVKECVDWTEKDLQIICKEMRKLAEEVMFWEETNNVLWKIS